MHLLRHEETSEKLMLIKKNLISQDSSTVMAPNTKRTSTDDRDIDPAIAIGRFYANPPPGDEVCITGIAGAFADSYNLDHFKENLFNKVDMITDDERRWDRFHPEIPQRTGKLFDAEKFDAGFFGVPYGHVESMCPMLRLILEKSVECVMDAGLNPSELKGTKTGVFVGACFSEAERETYYQDIETRVTPIIGGLRSFLAHRVSHVLKLDGPSCVVDTACSSSSFAIENAYRNIRSGNCDNAIVGGINLCLHPHASLQFDRLGLLSDDGKCKTFDEQADGYCRSETVSCVLLQKAKHSRRIYAKIIHSKTNCDGFKAEGITYPSGELQQILLDECYEECEIDPANVGFIEAHGTGTKVGDAEEGRTIERVFCTNRNEPLVVGAVKSNVGHSEAGSGLVAVAKCLIALEEGFIPPNLHYYQPRKDVKGLVEGRIKIPVEKTPIPDNNGTVGMSSFGFGGANAHILLEWNHKEKKHGGKPNDDIPRLICVSGRTPEAISSLLHRANEKFDAEYIQLLHEIFKIGIDCHNHRGFSIVSKSGPILSSCKRYSEVKPNLLLTFGDFGNSWWSFPEHFLVLPVFSRTIQNIHQILSRKDVNISEILQNSGTLNTHPVVNHILGTVALQIGIIEILRSLKVEPDAVMGVAIGEIACGYFDGFLTLEQAVLTALEIGNHLKDISKVSATYVVKFVDKKNLTSLPSNVEVTWKYSDNEVALSGEPKAVYKFATNLKEKGAEVYEIGSNNVTMHSRNNSQIEPSLLENLRMLIPGRKLRSRSWLSASNESNASAEYFVKSLYSPVNTQNIVSSLKNETVVLELGIGRTSALLNHARNKSLNVVSFNEESKENALVAFLEVLGNLYECGFNPQIINLYPKVQYPVSRGTPFISSQIKWEHSKNWHLLKYTDIKQTEYGTKAIGVNLKRKEWMYVTGHVIDGRNLFPATGYVDLVWETFAATKRRIKEEMNIVIENCKLYRATTLQEQTDFHIEIQKKTGRFEIIQGGVDIVNGTIRSVEDNEVEQHLLPLPADDFNSKIPRMDADDIYKELRLRGYQYKDAFQMVEKCNLNATKAFVKWNGNWVSFMDNMLQIRILQIDTRLLYIPTSFKRITINARKHLAFVESFGENPILPVYVYKDAGIIRCGGIEIRGLSASSIARRKLTGQPVLEKYEFIPNETTVSLAESVRINMQIALENLYVLKVNAVEVFDDSSPEGTEPLGPLIYDAISDQPLIQANITILTKRDLVGENVNIEKDKTLANESDCYLVVGTKILQKPHMLNQALGALKEKGFILSLEELDFDSEQMNQPELEILTVHRTEEEKLIFFRKSISQMTPVVVEISDKDEDFNWLSELQQVMKTSRNVSLYAQNEEFNGLLGLHNCIRREAGGTNVQCFLIYGNDTPPFNIDDTFYWNQLKKDLSVNIYKNGKWGTYRHMLMRESEEVESEHCFVHQKTRGDLSSLKLTQGTLTSETQLSPENVLVQVYYASINFKDIMIASGRINADVKTLDRIEQQCVHGFEFCGRDSKGKKVMGITSSALSTLVIADSHLLFDVPDKWSLEEAATVPVVYATVLYALFGRGKLRKGESILIHSGTGGIGQAAINIALAYRCQVFVTVGTPEKRESIKKLFPQLSDRHIGNSRDSTFEVVVKKGTGGKGVDVVLNSLAEEKLIASVRCLAKGGRFLEIGKFDTANDNPLALALIEKECSFHGVMLDHLFSSSSLMKNIIFTLFTEGLKNGMIKPLSTNVFLMNEVEEAFRFMSSGKHKGKVLIQIQKETSQYNNFCSVIRNKAEARYSCDPEKSYVILGGLGGFGLELADWLVLRGAKKIVLNSRHGVKKGYQAYRINSWKSYGVIIHISTADVTTREGCDTLITESEELGPVDGLFNLAVILKDAILENQTPDAFKISFGPKITATKYLDGITRKRCSYLRHFVIFSSVSCGRGNAGQTNYGMANSAMERICERRKKAGYSALAVQWGAVADVGLLAEQQKDHIELGISGTLQQRISSCLQVLDTFLCQKEATIVSSFVVAEKKKVGSADNVADAAADIIGIKRSTVSPHATLAELGMDSMTAIEMKQTLEREFEIFLSPQEIRSLTFAKLQEIQDARLAPTQETKAVVIHEPSGFDLFLKSLGDGSTEAVPVVTLPSLAEDSSDAPVVFAFPGIEGYVDTLKPLTVQLQAKVIGLQCCYKETPTDIVTTAKECFEEMKPYLKPDAVINIIAFSWGSIIALEVTSLLEKNHHKVNLILLDGGPELVQKLIESEVKGATEVERHVAILCRIMLKYYPFDIVLPYKAIWSKYSTSEERLEAFLEALKGLDTFTEEYKRTASRALCERVMEVFVYTPSYKTINASIKLFKPSSPICQTGLPEDYNLSKFCTNLQEVKVFEGNHASMLGNPALAEEINETFNK